MAGAQRASDAEGCRGRADARGAGAGAQVPHSGQTVAADGEQLVRVKREGKGTLGEAKGHIEVRMGPPGGVRSQQGRRRGQRRMQRAARWGGGGCRAGHVPGG
jgi:hypothetical protein